MNEQAELFLDTYRRLETAAEHLVGDDTRSSVIMRLARHRLFEKYRDELDYCRQVRNLLTHEAKIGGAYGVVPSDQLLLFLQKILRMVEHPPVVRDRMTPVDALLLARPDEPVAPLMARMKQKGVSHVPLLTNGVVTGIFSVDTVFEAALARPAGWNADAVVQDFAPYLPISDQRENSYLFVAEDLELDLARDLFDTAYGRNEQIKLLLVTRRGRPEEKLLGVVSPYDLLDED